MIWYSVIITSLALVLLIMLIIYRLQIKKICIRMAFVRKNNSNMIIKTDFKFKDLSVLTDEVNKIVEQQRKVAFDYKQSDNSLKNTITNISHDIRTPLTSLDGYFQLLSESENSEEKEKYIKIISERIEILKDILEELFTYTKLQDNEYKLELEKINISKLALDTVFSFYDNFQEVGLQPEIDIIESPVYIMGNETAIYRIFQNIIKNALVHGNDLVKIKMNEKDTKVIIEISNNYKRDDIIHIQQLFDRFYKADKSRSKNSAGLGLYISKELVKIMNGEIDVSMDSDIFTVTVIFAKL